MTTCSNQTLLVNELFMDGFPSVHDFRASCLDRLCCLPFISNLMFPVTVFGSDSLTHSLISTLLFKVVLAVEVISNISSFAPFL